MTSADGKVLNRTWTISSHPDESAASNTFAITVKKAGLVSSYLHRRATNALTRNPRSALRAYTWKAARWQMAQTLAPGNIIRAPLGISPVQRESRPCLGAQVVRHAVLDRPEAGHRELDVRFSAHLGCPLALRRYLSEHGERACLCTLKQAPGLSDVHCLTPSSLHDPMESVFLSHALRVFLPSHGPESGLHWSQDQHAHTVHGMLRPSWASTARPVQTKASWSRVCKHII